MSQGNIVKRIDNVASVLLYKNGALNAIVRQYQVGAGKVLYSHTNSKDERFSQQISGVQVLPLEKPVGNVAQVNYFLGNKDKPRWIDFSEIKFYTDTLKELTF